VPEQTEDPAVTVIPVQVTLQTAADHATSLQFYGGDHLRYIRTAPTLEAVDFKFLWIIPTQCDAPTIPAVYEHLRVDQIVLVRGTTK
jgi:hypothetical protein